MGALTATVPANTGTVTTSGGAVASTDTIAAAQMGKNGCYLEIINGGGSSDTVAISDAGSTPAGNAVGTVGSAVSNGTNKTFRIHRSQLAPTTQLVTVTHSFTTSVTYKLLPF